MENLPKVTLDDKVVAEKNKNWGDMGVAIYKRELQFSAIAQSLILKIKLPTKIEDIQESEVLLKTIKQEVKKLAESRLEITNRFRDVADRLSAPEKSVLKPIEDLTNAIIKLKEDLAKKQKEEQAKDNEKKSVKENILRQLAEVKATYANKILTQVTKAYTWALENKVALDKLDEYLSKVGDKFKVTDFADSAVMPQLFKLTETEYKAFAEELFVLDSNNYVDQYKKDLKAKFEFYHIDFKNAEQALEKAKDEKVEAEQSIQTEKSNAQMSATLESMSMDISTISNVKELKKSFEVVTTTELKDAIAIITAFIANLELCKLKLRVTDYSKLTVAQMATALAKVKCDDNKFQPSNIEFKEVSKL